MLFVFSFYWLCIDRLKRAGKIVSSWFQEHKSQAMIMFKEEGSKAICWNIHYWKTADYFLFSFHIYGIGSCFKACALNISFLSYFISTEFPLTFQNVVDSIIRSDVLQLKVCQLYSIYYLVEKVIFFFIFQYCILGTSHFFAVIQNSLTVMITTNLNWS